MDDFNKLIAGEKPTLVDFFATWCGPCKVQGPILEDVKNKVGDAANIIKIDVDKNNALAMQYNVRSVPTLIMFKLGTAVWRAVGVQTADELIRKIKEHEHTKKDEIKVDPA
ncbi:MAG: thioredoxin [Bacteroidales bacterium]|nr:thioredoxin [Bacteroidales bacterium]